MKALMYIFLVLTSLSGPDVYRNDQRSNAVSEYDIVIFEYFESEKDIQRIDIPADNQVIIYDSNGGITRQIKLEEDIGLHTPSILKPVIDKAEFLTVIHGIYYFICEKK